MDRNANLLLLLGQHLLPSGKCDRGARRVDMTSCLLDKAEWRAKPASC